MENAKRDDNFVTTLTGVDMTTGKLPTLLFVDETTHRLLVSAVITQMPAISIDKTGLATETKQDGIITAIGNIPTTNVSALATIAKQNEIIAELQKKVNATEAQLVQQDNYMRVLSQAITRPIYFNPATGMLKVDSHAVTLSATNVTTLTNFGTLAADVMSRNTSINTWANTARRTIT